MGQKKGILRHRKIHFPTSKGVSEVSERTSERSGGREQSKQSGASERVSGASERVNGRASDPVLQSVFLAVIDHSVRRIFSVVGFWFNLKMYEINYISLKRKAGVSPLLYPTELNICTCA